MDAGSYKAEYEAAHVVDEAGEGDQEIAKAHGASVGDDPLCMLDLDQEARIDHSEQPVEDDQATIRLTLLSLQLKGAQETAHIEVLGQLFSSGSDEYIAHIVGEAHKEEEQGVFPKVRFDVFGLALAGTVYQLLSLGL